MRSLILIALTACTPPASRPAVVEALDCDAVTASYALPDGTHLATDRDGHRLWRGDCAHGATLLVASGTTRFVGAATLDGQGFVYADRGAIQILDLATLQSRTLYTTPQLRDPVCGHATPPPRGEQDLELIDSVTGFDDAGRTLVLRRDVVGCEIEGKHSYEVRIPDFASAATPRAHPAHPIYDVAATGTALYMLDGAGLSRSVDLGATWTALWSLPNPARPGVPFAVVADAHTVIVVTSSNGPPRNEDATDIVGGTLYRSDDAGLTWRALHVPDELLNPCAVPHDGACIDGRGVEWIATPTGHLDTLAIGGELAGVVWTSHDGGTTWTRGSGRRAQRRRTAAIGATTFEATADGLVRIRDQARETISPELAEPHLVDRF